MTMLMSRLGAPPPDPSAPGMFALGDPQKLERAIEQAGFRDTTVAQVAGVQRHESFEAWWEETRELTAAFDDLVTAMDAAARERLMTALRTEAEAFEDDDGLAIPSLALLASAER